MQNSCYYKKVPGQLQLGSTVIAQYVLAYLDKIPVTEKKVL
jgi:hypothetical protein